MEGRNSSCTHAHYMVLKYHVNSSITLSSENWFSGTLLLKTKREEKRKAIESQSLCVLLYKKQTLFKREYIY